MSEIVNRKILSTIMDFIHTNRYTDLDGFTSKLAHRYYRLLKKSPSGVVFDDFLKSLRSIRTNFFVINRAKKVDFAQSLLLKLRMIELPFSNYEIAKDFISRFLEIGYDESNNIEERKQIISKFRTIKSPHEKLMSDFGTLLQRISKTFQISLHGTKEYSGIDISKKIGKSVLGFQIKSVNDDISEDKIRAQTSKALEFNLDGFVWIYARPRTKTVDSSIQAAYHHFRRINEHGKMYCAIIKPELLAELFRKYDVSP